MTDHLLCRIAGVFLAGLLLVGCEKKAQDAVVTGKEFIPAHVEGTPYKERETGEDQWWVNITMKNGQRTHAPVTKEEYDALQIGERVRAKYSEGKHTGTIWAIDLQKLEKQ